MRLILKINDPLSKESLPNKEKKNGPPTSIFRYVACMSSSTWSIFFFFLLGGGGSCCGIPSTPLGGVMVLFYFTAVVSFIAGRRYRFCLNERLRPPPFCQKVLPSGKQATIAGDATYKQNPRVGHHYRARGTHPSFTRRAKRSAGLTTTTTYYSMT